MKHIICVILMLFCVFFSCDDKIKKEDNKIAEIDNYIKKTMKAHEIPGLAIAVVHNDKVIHKAFYGKASIIGGSKMTDKTIFRLYSLTKLFTTVSIFKLIEEGKLGLNDPLSEHFDDLPEHWQNIEIANLLSHSSGLPDVRNYTKELSDDTITTEELVALLYDEEMDFATGEEWNYNQTNHLLLRLLIEKITKRLYEEYILTDQFDGYGEDNVLFSSDPSEDIKHRAKYYDFDRKDKSYKIKPEIPGIKGHPLNGINITLDAYISWNNRFDNNKLINEASKAMMWQPFNFKNSGRHFLYGWDVYTLNNYNSFGFSGGGVSGYRKFVDKGLTIIVLTNGYRYYAMQDIIANQVAGIIDTTLQDEHLALTESIMADYFLEENMDIDAVFKVITKQYPGKNLEEVYKSIGYTLFFQLNRKQDAIDLFKQNVLEYPDAYDTYGSLAYLYFLDKQYKIARKYYVKALEINPENSYSERTIKKIDDLLKKQLN